MIASNPRGSTGPQRSAGVDLERLVDSFVADPHGLIIGLVHRQPPGDLFRTPRLITSMWLVTALPRRAGRSDPELPAWRNQRNPTGDDTPASAAASSVFAPAAMAAQNRTRTWRQATGGGPGERKGMRLRFPTS